MKLFTRILLILSIISFSSAVFSQSKNYEAATIINNDNETLTGFVKNEDWRQNPNEILFKKEMEDEEKTYAATDIKSFQLSSGGKYISQKIIIENSKFRVLTEIDELNYLEVQREPVLDTLTTFIQLAVDGKKKLYIYKDARYRSHFFIKKDKKIEYLYYGIQLYDENSNVKEISSNHKADGFAWLNTQQMSIIENKEYINQLKSYFKKCSVIGDILGNVSYEKNDIIKLFSKYATCKDEEVTIENIADKQVNYYLIGGLSSTNLLKYEASPTYTGRYLPLIDGVSENPLTPILGGAVEFVLPGLYGRHSLMNSLMYRSIHLKGSWNQFDREEDTRIKNYEFKINYIKLNTLYQYRQPLSSSISFFVQGGIGHGFGKVQTNEMIEETNFFGSYNVRETEALTYVRKYQLSGIGGLGLSFQRFSALIHYELGYELSEVRTVGTRTGSLNLMLGYQLNK